MKRKRETKTPKKGIEDLRDYYDIDHMTLDDIDFLIRRHQNIIEKLRYLKSIRIKEQDLYGATRHKN